eukprot:EG_transcript_46292
MSGIISSRNWHEAQKRPKIYQLLTKFAIFAKLSKRIAISGKNWQYLQQTAKKQLYLLVKCLENDRNLFPLPFRVQQLRKNCGSCREKMWEIAEIAEILQEFVEIVEGVWIL